MALLILKGKNVERNNFWFQYLERRIKNNSNNLVCVYGPTGCLLEGSKVLMSDGTWKKVQDVEIGEKVMSPQKDGSQVYSTVLKKNIWECDEIYNLKKINKGKQDVVSVSYNHEHPTCNPSTKEHKLYSAREMSQISDSTLSRERQSFTTPLIKKFEGRKNCKVEPYTLGIFLGDGMMISQTKIVPNKNYDTQKNKNKIKFHKRTRNVLNIFTEDKIVMEEIKKHYELLNVRNENNKDCTEYIFSSGSKLFKELTELNLQNKKSGDKFIPKEALYSDWEYRKKLLAGLIDSDGYLSKQCSYSYCTKSKQLAEDIKFLVHSLGGQVQINKIKKQIKEYNFEGEYYNLTLEFQDVEVPIKTPRRIKNNNKERHRNSSNSVAIKCELDETKRGRKVVGLLIDSPSHYLITNEFLVSKNSGKTWTAISICEMLAARNGTKFTIDNIVFQLSDLLRLVNSHPPKGTCIIFDEPQVSISSREYMTQTNRVFNYLLTTFRHRNLSLFFCTPYVDLLDKTARKLFHANLETERIDRTNNLSIVRAKTHEYNSKQERDYDKYLVVVMEDGKGKRIKFQQRLWAVPKPTTKMIKLYEKKKTDFTDKLNTDILKTLNKLELKETKVIDPNKLTEKEQETFDLMQKHQNGLVVAKILGVNDSVVYRRLANIESKGIKVEKNLTRGPNPRKISQIV